MLQDVFGQDLFDILNEGPNGPRGFHRQAKFCKGCLTWGKSQLAQQRSRGIRPNNAPTPTASCSMATASSSTAEACDTIDEDSK